MPNARLRQMYSAMLRMRMLAERIGPNDGSRPRQKRASLRGLEACLVSPTVDLSPDDLIMDSLQNPALDFLRGASAEQVLRPGRRLRSTGTHADCGAATSVIAPIGGQERLWAALGAASALKANSKRTAAKDGAVLVCYIGAADAPPAVWAKALTCISTHKLPVLFVVLPPGKAQSTRTGHLAAVALRNHVPGMPVDQHDAVALYRVAQESIGHARIGGGGALIECVRYAAEGQRSAQADAIDGLGHYMLHRQVADPRWMAAETNSFARRIGA
jgi:acetoin:2,6-dichlorophenolindophenol oxidoreductase subunit alpha